MQLDNSLIERAIAFLRAEKSTEQQVQAADILRKCYLDNCQIFKGRRDDSDGVIIDLIGPREAYDSLDDNRSLIGSAIRNAFRAVLPNKLYLMKIRVCVNITEPSSEVIPTGKLSESELKELINKIERLRKLMIDSATGHVNVDNTNQSYIDQHVEIAQKLKTLDIKDPHPYPDLWEWRSNWRKK